MRRSVASDISALCVLVSLLSCPLSANGHAHLEVPPARNWVAARANPDHKCLGGEGCKKTGPNPWDPIQDCQIGLNFGCQETNHWSLQAGGPALVKERSKTAEHPRGLWPSPPYSHGLCGDPVQDRASKKEFWQDWRKEQYMVPTPPQVTYKAGDTVDFKICVHAHHMGFNEFRICETGLDGKTLESIQAGQGCLDKWVLKRAPPREDCVANDRRPDCQPIDKLHPTRWHWPSGMYDSMEVAGLLNHSSVQPIIAGTDWNDSWIDSQPQTHVNSQDSDVGLQMAGSCYTQRYVIPDDLSCEKCTLQWWWVSGNQCLYDQDVRKYMAQMQEEGWQPFTRAEAICSEVGAYGEEFWNCADITVKGKNEPTPAPPPAPATRRRNTRRRQGERRRRRRRRSARRRSSRRRSSRRRSMRRRRR